MAAASALALVNPPPALAPQHVVRDVFRGLPEPVHERHPLPELRGLPCEDDEHRLRRVVGAPGVVQPAQARRIHHLRMAFDESAKRFFRPAPCVAIQEFAVSRHAVLSDNFHFRPQMAAR